MSGPESKANWSIFITVAANTGLRLSCLGQLLGAETHRYRPVYHHRKVQATGGTETALEEVAPKDNLVVHHRSSSPNLESVL